MPREKGLVRAEMLDALDDLANCIEEKIKAELDRVQYLRGIRAELEEDGSPPTCNLAALREMAQTLQSAQLREQELILRVFRLFRETIHV